MKTMIITATLAALAASGVAALAGTFEAWGHTFTYGDFAPRSLDVTIATETSTGHKMNLVRLKYEHMMALVPADRFLALMPSSSEEDMVK